MNFVAKILHLLDNQALKGVSMAKSFFYLLLSLTLLTGCSHKSLEDYREEGRRLTTQLIAELQGVHSRRDLVARQPKLNKLFKDLVATMISAQEWRDKQAVQIEVELTIEDHDLSDRLKAEMNRIYKIEGAREVLEKSQQEALFTLDAFHKKRETAK